MVCSKSWCTVRLRENLDMSQFFPAAVLDQQVPADQIRETRTVLEAIVPHDGTTGLKFGACEEIAHFLKLERRIGARDSSDGR